MQSTNNKVSYSKDFHITAKGEIIKIAAIVTENFCIRKRLEEQRQERDRLNNLKQYVQTGEEVTYFVSVLEGTNKRF